jgi:phosphohistidine swiveling domain-containing protein
VDTAGTWVIPLETASDCDEGLVGGKAAKLGDLLKAGFPVPGGFCVPVPAYERFIHEAGLVRVIEMELERKPFDTMRWEEIWDAALRIRSAFSAARVPEPIRQEVAAAVNRLGANCEMAVRSSAPGEDSGGRSFAGLHESIVGPRGPEAVLQAIKLVWASLWSDAALLYRKELSLDPEASRMSVVVQTVVDEPRSGVAFGRDPRDLALEQEIVEAVPGRCSGLVDGAVDPDRWVLDRSTGAVISWKSGDREGDPESAPLLVEEDLGTIHQHLHRAESLLGWPADMEWTGQQGRFTVLQARPITTGKPAGDEEREWYLSLRPGADRLSALARKVSQDLIPRLEAEGRRLAEEDLAIMDDGVLADAIQARAATLEEWKLVYRDEFIPFAHGVRRLATYYNDAVCPDDPYQFVGLLRGTQMLAGKRNSALSKLAGLAAANKALGELLEDWLAAGDHAWASLEAQLSGITDGIQFLQEIRSTSEEHMDVTFGGERLDHRPDLLVGHILELARRADEVPQPEQRGSGTALAAAELERGLMAAVGKDRVEEALEVLAVGRLSWRLRDDDNLLVGRLESQLSRAVVLGAQRMATSGRLPVPDRVSVAAADLIARGLRDPALAIELPPEEEPASAEGVCESEGKARPRQLVGQPGSSGMATGRVRRVLGPEDLGRFKAGEVLVCDAIQPNMTHLVPLASAVVERRGGMLIHGSIIARELGLPCVNGIPDLVSQLADGDLVTVDGSLGVVTVGEPEFDLELNS